jgi:TolB-like protein
MIVSIVTVLQIRKTPPEDSLTRLAVLPLQNVSPEPAETDYLAEGISRTLTTKLTQVAGLAVTPWMTVSRFTDSSRPLAEVASELQVNFLVVGWIRKVGDRIEGSISLVEASTGFQSWAKEFDEQATDIFEVERTIAIATATSLKGRLSAEDERTLAQPTTQSVSAYDFYLKGAHEMQGGTRLASDLALAFFLKAVQIDPRLAEAYVGIGTVQLDHYFYGRAEESDLEAAEGNFKTALRLNPALAAAHEALARLYWERGMVQECLEAGAAGMKREHPGVDELFAFAQSHLLCGVPRNAVTLFRRILEIDPASEAAHWWLVVSSAWAGQFEESIELGEIFLRRFGEDPEMYTWIAVSFHALGELEAAAFYYDKALEIFGDDSNFYVSIYAGSLYERDGQPDEARRIWSEALELTSWRLDLHPDNNRVRTIRIALYALLGERQLFDQEVNELRDRLSGTFAWHLVGVGYVALGEVDRGLEVFRHLARRGNSPPFGIEALQSPLHIERIKEAPAYGDFLRELKEAEERLALPN